MNKIAFYIPVVTLALLICGMLFSGCAPTSDSSAKDSVERNVNRNEIAVDSLCNTLKTGNVVLRMGFGAQSRLLAQINRTNKSFSHCGIVIVENGYPFIYHSIGGEDNPDMRLRRDSANVFFSPLYCQTIGVAEYDFDKTSLLILCDVVKNTYRRRPHFDTHFDMVSDDELYCTEFVYKSIAKATGDSSYIPLSEAMGRRFVGTDNLFENEHAHLIWQVKF